MSNTTTTCRCGRPTRDEAYVCDTCLQSLAVALGDVAWLEAELEVTITNTKGVDYRTKGGTRASERPSPVVWGAAEARGHLRALLVSWTLYAAQEGVRNSSPTQTLPADTLTAMSRYLLWRVDGLGLHDIGSDAVEEITSAVAHCHRLIDRPAERQYLGDCPDCTDGRLYARPGGDRARCDACDHTEDAAAVRDRLLSALEDRLCTAAEIARLSTYLGLKANRDQVRQRINQWHARGVIASESMFDEPAFRFGTIYKKLVEDDYAGKRKAAA